MARFLVAYSSKNGQTEKISYYLKERIMQMGHLAEIHDCSGRFRWHDMAVYDGVIVGGPVYAGKYPRQLRKWVQFQSFDIAGIPTAFFSVCLGILQNDQIVHQEESIIVENFFEQMDWHPKHWTIFAGALPFSKYNFLYKFLMKRIARKAGVVVNTNQDYEYTNWEQVDFFVDSFVKEVVVNLSNLRR